MIELQTIVSRGEGLFTAPVDDEIVILNPERDSYLGLDRVGTAVWELMEGPIAVETICAQLAEQFDGTDEQIRSDVIAFLTELADEGLARRVD